MKKVQLDECRNHQILQLGHNDTEVTHMVAPQTVNKHLNNLQLLSSQSKTYYITRFIQRII